LHLLIEPLPHHTPKHTSWLNIVEIEVGVLRNQCLDRRIADRTTLERQIAAWEKQRNNEDACITWMFTTERARAKLARAYPVTRSRNHSAEPLVAFRDRVVELWRRSLRRRRRSSCPANNGRLYPPILAGSVRPVVRTRCISLIAADGLTAKRTAACRIELPSPTARTIRARKSADKGRAVPKPPAPASLNQA